MPRTKMKVLATIACLCVVVATVSSTGAIGGRKPLRGDEFKSEHVQSAVRFATSEIHKQKLRNGEVTECVGLNAKILRGSTQVVSGTKYNLELRMAPISVMGENCANKVTSGLEQFKPEVCEVEVWSRSWKQPPSMELVRSVCLQIED